MQGKEIRYRPGHGGYVSEFTRFIDGFLAAHPEVGASQRHGWYIYWDHNVDLAEEELARRDSVPPKPYSYD
ncbi:DUF3460 family protein [Janthinobacterium fluminis]|uniref:DUF3460 family protein n=1 Tax=Janthinobacterium fluminis TaxID=2987524 RepID=A0ABT5JUQ9_9BURK|nr:DUF3460 family protein [Janthinobacterium fluminis]MDC8756470.1 DUF3460 family protein [Janthinobacterium fluminis]